MALEESALEHRAAPLHSAAVARRRPSRRQENTIAQRTRPGRYDSILPLRAAGRPNRCAGDLGSSAVAGGATEGARWGQPGFGRGRAPARVRLSLPPFVSTAGLQNRHPQHSWFDGLSARRPNEGAHLARADRRAEEIESGACLERRLSPQPAPGLGCRQRKKKYSLGVVRA